MSFDVRAIAIRFADLWAVDPHQMVEEIYAEDIAIESMANPARTIKGSAELHAVEDALAARIPEHRHELIRVIVDGTIACMETIVVGPLTGEFAPACVWWWFDESGKVGEEVGWFNWDERNTDSKVTHGTVPPNVVPSPLRDQQWFRHFADRFTELWATDPLGAYLEMFDADCTFGHVGRQEARGLGALGDAELAMLEAVPLADRSIQVHSTVGEGSVLAILLTIGSATHTTRGTFVLTLDRHAAIVSRREYCDWSRAVARPVFA